MEKPSIAFKEQRATGRSSVNVIPTSPTMMMGEQEKVKSHLFCLQKYVPGIGFWLLRPATPSSTQYMLLQLYIYPGPRWLAGWLAGCVEMVIKDVAAAAAAPVTVSSTRRESSQPNECERGRRVNWQRRASSRHSSWRGTR